MLFKLKVGSHIEGVNDENQRARRFNAKDPEAKNSFGNIVESDENLAEQDPMKFEVYTGPTPVRLLTKSRSTSEKGGKDISNMTKEELTEEAERLLRKAADLRRKAVEIDEQEKENEKQPEPLSTEEKGVKTKETSTKEAQDKTPVTSEKDYHDRLDKMSLSDLKSHAAERKIDLKDATIRADVLKTIKSAK